MEPFIKEGDFVFVSPMSYLLSYPKVKDVIVLQHPTEGNRKILKRIVRAKEGRLFWVEGDNKEKSEDSRSFGWISQKLILGKAKLIQNARRGREDWVSSRVGNYSKPRVLKE